MREITTVGIDKDLGKDSLIGIGVTIAFIILGSIFGIVGTIGIPVMSASIAGVIGRALIIIFVASIFETFLFFEFVLDFFDNKLKTFNLDLPYIIAAILTSVIFALFHLTAYSGSLRAASGSFLSASIIGFGWCYLRKWTKSLLPVLISHIILNAWILSKLAVIIG